MNYSSDSLDKIEQIAEHYRAIISLIGDDPSREGLEKTPMRAAKALWDTTCGIGQSAEEVVNDAIFEAASKGMVVVRDIEFYSFCEHHILPFFGKVSIGYIPGKKMIGLSKLARIVNVYARRLQVQERLTAQICEAVDRILAPKGVIVRCTAGHLCMKMRGVEKQESVTETVEATGVFETDRELRNEFLNAICH